MSFLFFFILYNEGGHEYDSPLKKILISVEQSTVDFVVCKEVITIVAGTIGSSAFSLCQNVIRSVEFEKDSNVRDLGDFLFADSSLEKIDFSNCLQLESIPIRCFQSCTKLVNLTLPPNLKIIKGGALFNIGVTHLDIPDSLTTIDDYSYHGAIHSCKSLTSIEFGKNSNLTKIGTYAFLQAALKKIVLPKKLTTINTGAFAFCPLEEIIIDQENNDFSTDGKAIYSKDFKTLYSVTCFEERS